MPRTRSARTCSLSRSAPRTEKGCLMPNDVKMECVREIEAVIGRELDEGEATALYADSGLTGLMQAKGITLGELKSRLGAEAGGLERDAEVARRRAKALRKVSRALYAHRGLPSEACAALTAAAARGEAPRCPICGGELGPCGSSEGECLGLAALECPKCGARPRCKGLPVEGADCLVMVGVDDMPMSALAAKSRMRTQAGATRRWEKR